MGERRLHDDARPGWLLIGGVRFRGIGGRIRDTDGFRAAYGLGTAYGRRVAHGRRVSDSFRDDGNSHSLDQRKLGWLRIGGHARHLHQRVGFLGRADGDLQR